MSESLPNDFDQVDPKLDEEFDDFDFDYGEDDDDDLLEEEEEKTSKEQTRDCRANQVSESQFKNQNTRKRDAETAQLVKIATRH